MFRNAGRRAAGGLAAVLLIASLAAPLAAIAQALTPIDRPVAIVDEDVVLQSELDAAIANIRGQYASRPDQLPPEDVLKKQVLERLILNKLQVARAESSGIKATDQDVDAAIDRIAQGNNLTQDQLRAQVAQTGQSWDSFRRSIRDEMMIQQMRQSYAQGRIQVSDSEVDAALASQANNTQYHLANLLVGLPDGATADQIATGEKKIEGVKALIDKGEMDFAAAAVRYSDAQNALEGGDLGWRGLDEIPPTFANVIRTMEAGQVIGPIRGPSGFQLVKLIEMREAGAEAAQITEFHARHILARVDDKHPEAAARAKIDTLAARLAGGADFEALAKSDSEDENTQSEGGDLGWFPSDRFGTNFGSQVAALADNGISKPFRTDAGWHIVQRLGARQAEGDSSRRTAMREAIGRRKLEDEYNRFLREMRGEAFVELRDASGKAEPAAAPAAPAAEQPAPPPPPAKSGG
ncbi:peptidylprolyl isomerase [Lysobacter sp. KIS68-7]|uniref:peptidylprolyl isomerase n=1 Tax=Lysobacter sp. KIS68-7 TaxID=2904252 RepID=UPI001E2D313F|nr:peptidylprolyl isomerase [Lysobacter sp. KIS68-7]UHQ21094.1 peptidylprolyl isomerase [Lysobacter sp. KIS68-7]